MMLRRRAGFGALGLLVLMLAAVPRLYEPPEAAPRDASAEEFSALRARDALRGVADGGAPRPAGSAANARGRDALVARFERLGYATELQETFACGASGRCARVANLLAWRPGGGQGRVVLLMAHYDSVAAGPGAADDGSGVAILLESARALAARSPARHPVLFLLTDGEELGLLGAEAFLADHPSSARVGAVINVEARGSGGPSAMFETGPGNAGAVRLLAAAARRPVTSSVFDAIYRQLPNDTDFTPFKARGLPGLNFAFIGHPLRYHTREDRLVHLDADSVQQQGSNALAAARAFAAADLARLPRGEAVFFDLLGRTVIWWPVEWNIGLAGLALLLLAAAVWRAWRSGHLRLLHLLWGVAGVVAVPAVAWGLSRGLVALVRRTGASPGPWVAEPVPLILAFWLLAAVAALAPAMAAARRVHHAGLWAGTWLAWALLGLLFAAVAPGTAYLALVPALTAGLAVLPRLRSGRLPDGVGAVLPVLVAAALWFPLLWFLYDGMGLPIMPVVAALAALLLWGLAPALPGGETRGAWSLPVAAGIAGLLCMGLAITRPPYTADQPRPLNIYFVQDADSGKAVWAAGVSHGPLPSPLLAAAHFPSTIAQPLPWVPRFEAFAATAPPIAADPPRLIVLSDRVEGAKRRLRVRLHSPRGAGSVGLALPPEIEIVSARVAGRRIPDRPAKTAARGRDWQRIEVRSVAANGVEIQLLLRSRNRLPAVIYDETGDLPPAARPLLDARPATASPIGHGDRSVLFRRVEL